MKIERFFFLTKAIGVFLLFLLINPSITAKAESVSSTETESVVSFYGKYESESEPQPNPPDGAQLDSPDQTITKPGGGSLPQLGQLVQYQWWLGIAILIVGLMIHNRKQRYGRVS